MAWTEETVRQPYLLFLKLVDKYKIEDGSLPGDKRQDSAKRRHQEKDARKAEKRSLIEAVEVEETKKCTELHDTYLRKPTHAIGYHICRQFR